MKQIKGRPAPEFNLHGALWGNAKCSRPHVYQFRKKSNLLKFLPLVVIKVRKGTIT